MDPFPRGLQWIGRNLRLRTMEGTTSQQGETPSELYQYLSLPVQVPASNSGFSPERWSGKIHGRICCLRSHTDLSDSWNFNEYSSANDVNAMNIPVPIMTMQ